MNLLEIIDRPPVPEPWAEGGKIPWDEPGFSRRMLAEHLSQAHDAASRRATLIDAHVAWIHQRLLDGRPARVLDLGCGPGLYTSRLARLGHTCTGIDFAPATIAYARDEAGRLGLSCTYDQQDLRTAAFGQGYGLAMFIFGEFNVFRPEDAAALLRKAYAALADGGQLLLEVSTFAGIRRIGRQPATWYSAGRGLFADRPHLCLHESSWDAQQRAATERWFIVDAASAEVERHAASIQAYTLAGYRRLLAANGFAEIRRYASLSGEGGRPGEFQVFVARKGPLAGG